MEPIRRPTQSTGGELFAEASRQVKLSLGLVMVMSAGIAMAASGLLSRAAPPVPSGSQLIIAIEPLPTASRGIRSPARPETGETSLAMRVP